MLLPFFFTSFARQTLFVLAVARVRRTMFASCSESFSLKQEGVGGRQKKAKHPREQLFTSSLCSFVPPLPSAAFGSESALVLLAVTVCQGANRFLLTGASGGQVWVFHYFFFFWYQIGIILAWVASVASIYVNAMGAGEVVSGACVCLFVLKSFFSSSPVFLHMREWAYV